MGEADPSPSPQKQPPPSAETPPVQFDPSRMIGIIRRKALIKELAALYHAECLSHCQELLELQRKWEEGFTDFQKRFTPVVHGEGIIILPLVLYGMGSPSDLVHGEPYTEVKTPEDTRKDIVRHPKRLKKTH